MKSNVGDGTLFFIIGGVGLCKSDTVGQLPS